jgi:hypothetical protein
MISHVLHGGARSNSSLTPIMAEQVGRSETAQKQLEMYQSQTEPFFSVALDCFTLSP